MNWGLHIKRIRESKRLSTTELARLSGITRSHLSNIERGIYKTHKPVTLKRLAFGLNISFEQLNREILEITNHRETPEQILERLRVSISSTVPIYEEFPFHAGDPVEPTDYVAVVRERVKGRVLEGYIVHGTCLEPEIKHGDIIIVDRDGQPDIGNIVACYYRNQIHLGRLRKIGDEIYLENNEQSIRLIDCPIAVPVVEVRRRLK